MLKKINIKAGVIKDDTVYSSEGRWSDSDKIRFYNGKPQKIGGWEKLSASSFSGAARAIHSWRDYNDNRLVAIGTHSNIYILISKTCLRFCIIITGFIRIFRLI